ncbi:hypothetical protein PENCOP_c003G04324 [Penicillium coprophilum]|uniref:Kinesin motor domain-containing protein n=1 Tax=Penicillium coprophilum TaxID=36646 RepID=A0A1V6UYT1_9EURO|nr:hypothetical protein PENCOP_c003G04324 [Penicillium coprophilum]
MEVSFGDTQLVGAQELVINSKPELLQLIEKATSFRQTAGTEKNDGSSSSHAICRIRAVNISPGVSEDGILYLIDLAGSQAARDLANHSADRMKETRDINISLSILKDCIRACLDPSGTRNSKNAVLACFNPSFLDTAASKNTLRYAHMLCSTEIKYQPAEHNPAIPKTWSNKFVRSYITRESGNPTISPSILAPHESGAQLLAIPLNKFVARCLRTQGVTDNQAKAFHAKLWCLHIDSTRGSGTDHKGDIDSIESIQQIANSEKSVSTVTHISTRNLVCDGERRTFRDRIRPVMILCPQNVVGKNMKDSLGNEIKKSYCLSQHEESELPGTRFQRYLCALVLSGGLPDSYEVSI